MLVEGDYHTHRITLEIVVLFLVYESTVCSTKVGQALYKDDTNKGCMRIDTV